MSPPYLYGSPGYIAAQRGHHSGTHNSHFGSHGSHYGSPGSHYGSPGSHNYIGSHGFYTPSGKMGTKLGRSRTVSADSGCDEGLDLMLLTPSVLDDTLLSWTTRLESVFQQEYSRARDVTETAKRILSRTEAEDGREAVLVDWRQQMKDVFDCTLDLVDCVNNDTKDGMWDYAGRCSGHVSSLEEVEEETRQEEARDLYLLPPWPGRVRERRRRRRRRQQRFNNLHSDNNNNNTLPRYKRRRRGLENSRSRIKKIYFKLKENEEIQRDILRGKHRSFSETVPDDFSHKIKMFHSVLDPEEMFEEWKWNLEEFEEVEHIFKVWKWNLQEYKEVEDLFKDWKWNLEEYEEVEDIFKDWKWNLQEYEEVEDIFKDWKWNLQECEEVEEIFKDWKWNLEEYEKVEDIFKDWKWNLQEYEEVEDIFKDWKWNLQEYEEVEDIFKDWKWNLQENEEVEDIFNNWKWNLQEYEEVEDIFNKWRWNVEDTKSMIYIPDGTEDEWAEFWDNFWLEDEAAEDDIREEEDDWTTWKFWDEFGNVENILQNMEDLVDLDLEARIKKEVQKMQGAQKIREVMQLFEIEDLLEIERFLNWTKELIVDVDEKLAGLEQEKETRAEVKSCLEICEEFINPGAGTVTPGAGTVTPGPGTVTPRAGTVTPGAGTVTPGAGTVTPGAGTVTPRDGTVTPRDETINFGEQTEPRDISDESFKGFEEDLIDLNYSSPQRYSSPYNGVEDLISWDESLDDVQLLEKIFTPPQPWIRTNWNVVSSSSAEPETKPSLPRPFLRRNSNPNRDEFSKKGGSVDPSCLCQNGIYWREQEENLLEKDDCPELNCPSCDVTTPTGKRSPPCSYGRRAKKPRTASLSDGTLQEAERRNRSSRPRRRRWLSFPEPEDIDQIFWRIEENSRPSSLSSEIDNLPFWDSPDVFGDSCELMESALPHSPPFTPPRDPANIYRTWRFIFNEPAPPHAKPRRAGGQEAGVFQDMEVVFGEWATGNLGGGTSGREERSLLLQKRPDPQDLPTVTTTTSSGRCSQTGFGASNWWGPEPSVNRA